MASQIKTMDDASNINDRELVSEYNNIEMTDVPEHINEHGLSGIEEIFKAKLKGWKKVEINIGVTGNSGV